MNEKDIDLLLRQVKNAILSRPSSAVTQNVSDELRELQEAISYLSSCLSESNLFLSELCKGNLNIPTPTRHNFLAGYLKELHSILKHLTWQASQVAGGDYRQSVSFLGEFSHSFNTMVAQLEEREIRLRRKSEALAHSQALLLSIMDSQRDWVVVADVESNEIIYTNRSARENFFDPQKNLHHCPRSGAILTWLHGRKGEEEREWEYPCELSGEERTLRIKGYSIEWDGREAFAYNITDITNEKVEMNNLQDMAYRDVLTGLYNRRHCLEELGKIAEDGMGFSIALIDLDGLKTVNDTYGHIMGDDYLGEVAGVLDRLTRTQDTVCRMGGDEFVVLLPGCPETLAQKRMESIQSEVERAKKDYHLSISFGVVYVPEGKKFVPDALLEQVDRMMYAMKLKNRRARGMKV